MLNSICPVCQNIHVSTFLMRAILSCFLLLQGQQQQQHYQTKETYWEASTCHISHNDGFCYFENWVREGVSSDWLNTWTFDHCCVFSTLLQKFMRKKIFVANGVTIMSYMFIMRDWVTASLLKFPGPSSVSWQPLRSSSR